MDKDQLWAVSYSPSQNGFHVDSLADELNSNISEYLRGSGGTYIVLGIFKTSNECNNFIDKMESEKDRILVSKQLLGTISKN